jgi:hypothetical protein
LVLGALLAARLAAEPPAQPGQRPANAGTEAAAAFERLKGLAGDWQQAIPKDEADKGQTAVRYRVIGAGSAVAETIFPGTEMEMESVYHLDGDQLRMTHYCCCGNQPQFRARAGADKDEIVFEFAGGTNLNPAKDAHMHTIRVRFAGPDRLQSSAELYTGGKPTETHSLDLVRKK